VDRNVPITDGAVHVSAHDALEADAQATAPGILKHIANSLGIPLDGFARYAISPSDHVRTLAENAEAFEIFSSIADHDARLKCLAYMRWIADQSTLR
jgi:hypothetical protein